MKYYVSLNYYKFTFKTRDEALEFAELALLAAESDMTIRVEIEKEPEPELGLPEEDPEEVEENE